MKSAQQGATLAVGLILLALVTLLGLAGAGTAHVERLLAQNETFRENAATAASAGIEMAIRVIMNSDPAAVPASLVGQVPGATDRYTCSLRFAGYELTLPQAPGAHLAGAHFEIVSTGASARHAVDRQRARVMRVVESTEPGVLPADCAPLVPRRCHVRGALERISWQRLPVE